MQRVEQASLLSFQFWRGAPKLPKIRILANLRAKAYIHIWMQAAVSADAANDNHQPSIVTPPSPPPPPSMLLFFIAAVVWSQRRKLLDECREFDDVMRLFQMPKFEFWSCWAKARQIRVTYLQALQVQPAASSSLYRATSSGRIR